MRLVKVKDIVSIERDGSVQKNSGTFYVVLLSKVITSLGSERSINRNTIEKLNPIDFAFLVDFMHEINHQVIKRIHQIQDNKKNAELEEQLKLFSEHSDDSF